MTCGVTADVHARLVLTSLASLASPGNHPVRYVNTTNMDNQVVLAAGVGFAWFLMEEEMEMEDECREGKKPRRVWVRGWINERHDLEQQNTAYKLQKELEMVSCMRMKLSNILLI